MLVLSRRQDEKIVFPNLGITVEILRIAGQAVRICVDAPSDVRVLRHELAEKLGEIITGEPGFRKSPTSSHELRNRLNKIGIALHLLHMQQENGLREESEQTLKKILSEFETLDDVLSAERANRQQPRRALIVEDDANESELLAGFLRMSGYQVDTACDGCDALDYLAEKGRPDFVLLDMQMPRCDGPTTISAIRDNPALESMRLFAVSGKEAAEVGVTIGPSGVDRWFQKPINPQVLVKQMNHELERAAQVA